MFKNYINLAIVVVFFYPILGGFLLRYRSKEQKKNVHSICSAISFLISMYIGMFTFKGIFINQNLHIFKSIYNAIPNNILVFFNTNHYMLFLVVLPMIIFTYYLIIKLTLELISSITINPIFDAIERFSRRRSSIFNRILGAMFQFPKSVAYVLLLCFSLNYIAIINDTNNVSYKFREQLQQSILYKKVSKGLVEPISNSKFAKKLPEIINNSFKIEVKEANGNSNSPNFSKGKVTVYYNGITLEEAIKSNKNIDSFSKNITQKKNGSYDKSKAIYEWLSTNIEYDYGKATRIMNNDFSQKSGAINTYSTKKGICFDYASLFVAMCRANDIPVRIVTGKGFNGDVWVNHAWNEVYIKEKDKWINVDPTFGVVSNYFDNTNFPLDHKDNKIVGQW